LKARPYIRLGGKGKLGQRPLLWWSTICSGIQTLALFPMLAKYSHRLLRLHRTSWICIVSIPLRRAFVTQIAVRESANIDHSKKQKMANVPNAIMISFGLLEVASSIDMLPKATFATS
jgi:hypothetical protein